MIRMVMCKKYKKKLPGLNQVPYPGILGQNIFNQISTQAWYDWGKYQTKLINELNLNMNNIEDRLFVKKEMDKFLFQ